MLTCCRIRTVVRVVLFICMTVLLQPCHARMPDPPLGIDSFWGAYESYRAARLGVYLIQPSDSVAWRPAPPPGTPVPPIWRDGRAIYPPAELNPDGTINEESLARFLRDPGSWTGPPLEPNHRDPYIPGELQLLHDLHATFMVFGTANTAKLIEAYGTALPSGIANRVGVFGDYLLVDPEVVHPFVPWWKGGQLSFHDVIKWTVRQDNYEKARIAAREPFKRLAASYEPYIDHDGFVGYMLLHEMVDDHNFTDRQARMGLKTLEDAIAAVRERDRDNPISIFQNYAWEDTAAGTAHEALFSGRSGLGWNVYMEETYPFASTIRSRRWWSDRPVEHGYIGGSYYRDLWQHVRNYRRLSLEMERYSEAFARANATGPSPEWWIEIQIHREYGVLTDREAKQTGLPAGDLFLKYRRPTRYEYRLQAYLGLACGARGVMAYRYSGHDLEEMRLGEQDGEAMTVTEMYSDRSGGPWKPTTYGNWLSEGPVAPGFTHYGRQTPPNGLSLRIPFSETAGRKSLPVQDGPVSKEDPKSLVIHGEEEFTERGNEYPFDYLADCFDGLGELLPLLRDLRWWWAVDGTEDEWYIQDNSTPPKRKTHLQTDLWNRNLRSRTPSYPLLADRFHVRRVIDPQWEDSLQLKGRTYRQSPIVIGLFDDPAEPSAEYYLVVNMRSNERRGKRFAPADAVDFELEWKDLENGRSVEPAIVWDSGDEANRLRVSSQTRSTVKAKVRLAGGGAMLVKLVP
ncbi:hypothetical protein GF324_00290 [bacterium]|nr:hypothetical protein [bacterium]